MKDNLVISRARIKAEYTPEEFLRKALIELAANDAPIGVFSSEFSKVKIDEHQVFAKCDKVETSYQASIGYEREEPYTDTETYYEDVPYTAIEEYYDLNVQARRKREVTKYRKVERHRPVTKYRTVIDWNVMQGTHETTVFSFTENNKQLYLNERRFGNSITKIKNGSLVIDEDLKNIELENSTIAKAMEKNASQASKSLIESLPGDHYRDLSSSSKIISTECGLQICPEYCVSFNYNNQSHFINAFPFGPMEMDGVKISSDESIRSVELQSKTDLSSWIKERNKETETRIWNSTKTNSFITLGLMALSVIFSCFVHYTFPIVLLFIAAVGSFVYDLFLIKSVTDKEENIASAEIEAEKIRSKKAMEGYSENHKKQMLEALNKKLVSLGLKPAEAYEI